MSNTKKITFKPMSSGVRFPGDNVLAKSWDIRIDGKTVGSIESSIRDLYMSVSQPGYSVTVTANIEGKEKPFREYSAAFSNRNAREARENRSTYVRRAKAWAIKQLEVISHE